MKDKRINVLQEEAVRLQDRLKLLVEQTSGLLTDIQRQSGRGKDAGSDPQAMRIYIAQIKLREKQYQDLYGKLEALSDEIAADESGQGASATTTRIMLQQMQAQIDLELGSLSNVSEELALWEQAAVTDSVAEKMSLLERLKKGLEKAGE